MELSQEIIQASIKWAREEEDRSCDLKIENHRHSVLRERIWLYDYSVLSGKYVETLDDIPKDGELKRISIEEKEKELQDLKGRLKELEEEM